jgi:hypothetical protein
MVYGMVLPTLYNLWDTFWIIHMMAMIINNLLFIYNIHDIPSNYMYMYIIPSLILNTP